MPIDFAPINKILLQIRNLETLNERITAETRREFEHRGGADDLMFTEPDLTRRLFVCHNAVFFLHAGLAEARAGLKSPEQLAPGADDEARVLWLQHLEQSSIEATLRDLIPKLLKLVLEAPTLDVPYPLLPVNGTAPNDEDTEPMELK